VWESSRDPVNNSFGDDCGVDDAVELNRLLLEVTTSEARAWEPLNVSAARNCFSEILARSDGRSRAYAPEESGWMFTAAALGVDEVRRRRVLSDESSEMLRISPTASEFPET
jgi:hypothetical protein